MPVAQVLGQRPAPAEPAGEPSLRAGHLAPVEPVVRAELSWSAELLLLAAREPPEAWHRPAASPAAAAFPAVADWVPEETPATAGQVAHFRAAQPALAAWVAAQPAPGRAGLAA